MIKKPIAIIGSIDPSRPDYDPPLRNLNASADAARALGKELARAKHPILVFSSNPSFIEAGIVAGYIASGEAQRNSIIMLYPRRKDPKIHGKFAEQDTHTNLFDPKTDTHPRWEVSYYQSLRDVEGILVVGGGRSTLILGLMALANRMPIVSVACFGGNAEEIWTLSKDKPWITSKDWNEMGSDGWADEMAEPLVESFTNQRAKINELLEVEGKKKEQVQKERDHRSMIAIGFGLVAAVFTIIGVFGKFLFRMENGWLGIYSICFLVVPISSGIAGSMFFTLRQDRKSGGTLLPPSIKETIAHGLWAGLGSAILFFLSQVTTNRDIKSLAKAVAEGIGGFDILLLFSLMIAFIAGLTYEAVFGKWEAVDASGAGGLEKKLG
jgi:hypothetical protein